MSKIKQIQIGEDTFDLGVNASDIDGQVGGTLPQGGTQGQVLIKNSATDYDTTWVDATADEIGVHSGKYEGYYQTIATHTYFYYETYSASADFITHGTGFLEKIYNDTMNNFDETATENVIKIYGSDGSGKFEIDIRLEDKTTGMKYGMRRRTTQNINSSQQIEFKVTLTNSHYNVSSLNVRGSEYLISLAILNSTAFTPNNDYQPATKKYVDDKIPQKSTMPTATSSDVGKIVQFIGTTDANYTNGYFYIGIDTSGTYSWEQLNVQPSSGGSSAITEYLWDVNTANYYLNDATKTITDTTALDNLKTILNSMIAGGESHQTLDRICIYNSATTVYHQYSCIQYFQSNLRRAILDTSSGQKYVSFMCPIYSSDRSKFTYGEIYVSVPITFNNEKTEITTIGNVTITYKYQDFAGLPYIANRKYDQVYNITINENEVYNLSQQVTSLTLSASSTFYYQETSLFFGTNSSGASVTVPATWSNIGDISNVTTSGSTTTGTLDADSNFIVSIFNDVAIWKKY